MLSVFNALLHLHIVPACASFSWLCVSRTSSEFKTDPNFKRLRAFILSLSEQWKQSVAWRSCCHTCRTAKHLKPLLMSSQRKKSKYKYKQVKNLSFTWGSFLETAMRLYLKLHISFGSCCEASCYITPTLTVYQKITVFFTLFYKNSHPPLLWQLEQAPSADEQHVIWLNPAKQQLNGLIKRTFSLFLQQPIFTTLHFCLFYLYRHLIESLDQRTGLKH